MSGAVRVAVLASGGGSNLQAILDYQDDLDARGGARAADVVLVASDRASAQALARARTRGIATAVLPDPADAAALTALLEQHGVELIALAGYLKRVPAAVTARWAGAIVNVHPALLPRFGGPGMYGIHVHRAVLAAGETGSGATVHFVDDVYDHGAVIAQARVPVHGDDTPETLAARVLAAEHALYPRTLHEVASMLMRQRR